METTTIRVDKEAYAALRVYCEERGLNTQAVLKAALVNAVKDDIGLKMVQKKLERA